MSADRTFSPTPTQRKAIRTTGRDVLLAAGPGSGKTRVLVGRIERLLKEGVPPERIAAITFTRKAAAEMKGRLRRQLLDEWRRTWEADSARARRMRSLAWSVERMYVGTIHSFCSAILRRYPHRAGLDPEFSVVDPSRARALLEDSIAEAVRGAAVTWERAPADSLQDLLDDHGGDYLSMLRALYGAGQRVDVSWEEIGRRTRRSVREYLPDGEALPGLTAEEAREVVSLVEKLFELRRDPAVRETKSYPPLIDALNGRWERLGPAVRDGNLEALREVVGLLRAPGRIPAKLAHPINRLRAVHVEASRRQLARAELRAAEALVLLMQDIDSRYRAKKDELAVIDHDDQQRLTLGVLREDPAARRKLLRQYPHLLVDEFQDTDGIQWELVRLLRGWGEEAGDLMLVGDADQSIYRFRGADVDVFRDARRQLQKEGASDLSMTRNFRSSPALVSIFNACFSPLLPEFAPLKAGDAAPAPEPGAAAEVVVVKREDETPYEARVQQGFAASRWIEEYVASDGRWGDVAVLVRATHAMEPVVEALEERGIPHRVVGARDFYLSQEVTDIRMLLTWLDDQGDDLALAGLLRSPLCGLDDATLMRIARVAGGTLYEKLAIAGKDDERLAAVCARLRRWRRKSRLASLQGLLLSVLDESGYREAHAAVGEGEQVVANLDKVIAAAGRAEREEGLHLSEFARRLRTLAEVKSEEGSAPVESEQADAVQVMTIHRAKGLEFPVVIIPDADASVRRFRASFVLHPKWGLGARTRARDEVKQFSEMKGESFFDRLLQREKEAALQEERRIFYVACTRAERRLVILGASKNLNEQCRDRSAAEALEHIRPTAHSYLGWLRRGLDNLDESLVRWRPYFPQQERARRDQRAEGAATTSLPRIRENAERGLYDAAAPGGTLRDRTHSVTALVDYRSCPRLYLLRHLLRWPEVSVDSLPAGTGRRTDPLLFGTLVHRVCELLPDIGVDEAAEVALSEQQIPADDEHLRRRVTRAVRRYTESDLYADIGRAHAMRRSHSEWSFACPLAPAGQASRPYLVGKIDQLYADRDGTWTVVDFKTDRIDPTEVRERTELHGFQVRLYAWVVRHLLQVDAVRGRIHYLHPGVTQPVSLRGQWGEIEEEMHRLITAIECEERAESFPPRGGELCVWCGYDFHCRTMTGEA